MTDKEFKRLSRSQLIDVIYQLQLKQEELTADNEKLTRALADKRLRVSKAGNIAEAALEIHNVMQAAEDAAAHYVEEIQSRVDNEYQLILKEAKDKAAAIIEKAQQEANAQAEGATPPPTGESTSSDAVDAEVVDCVPHKDVNGQDDFMATLKVPELGQQAPLATDTEATAALDRYMQVTDYEHTEKGQKVAFTIRPEKIRITLEPPATGSRTDVNVFSGIVEEPIYSGFQSKFYVRLETGKIIKVFKQHTDYMDEGPVIRWKDKVYVSWSAEDAYIVEDIEK
jgi:hypothetical protein